MGPPVLKRYRTTCCHHPIATEWHNHGPRQYQLFLDQAPGLVDPLFVVACPSCGRAFDMGNEGRNVFDMGYLEEVPQEAPVGQGSSA